MTDSALLPLLAGGEFVSGQALARAMGVSRTAVWKQLNKLAELGLEIEAERGRGYRVPGGIDLLDEDVIRGAMAPDSLALLSELVILQRTGSTNAEAMARIGEGAGSGYVCTAERQDAGRGRRGRQWVSPFARNLYVSVVWEYSEGAAVLEGMSLAVGVIAARALAACGLPGVRLKWPNDLLYGGAKLGGILLEMTGDAAGACQVVVGIGINVDMPDASAAAIDQDWTDVRRSGGAGHPGRSVLLGSLLDGLLPMLAGFERQGFAAYRDAWMELDAYAGASVILSTGSADMAGVARGVDERGALQLETTAGVRPVYGGEISLRAAP